ncbi:V/A-type H+-transporting ATPase subunit F [Aequitasia blattaphilus]|uniref:V-type ATP synthase subunit F n=1 Tax=Aequitasia blattaphilus TaxID=2949332 RepID=A0ABT1E5Q0_9FIRM|nr:V-type ATP synthase subunit F [Aequitasia blattaphilus]MCP1101036.1 V-type ATP synthase subunit F [Aequitasia blattaphilus]MCR8613676.1 V-type ATP synthase subunit F [Aequitasia blattaphilus]
MYKIAVIGDYDSIYGFATLGIDTFPIHDENEAKTKLKELTGGLYKIIYITESLASKLTEEIEKYEEQITPAIILIPGISDNTGEGINRVKQSVEKAVGSDILFGNQ